MFANKNQVSVFEKYLAKTSDYCTHEQWPQRPFLRILASVPLSRLLRKRRSTPWQFSEKVRDTLPQYYSMALKIPCKVFCNQLFFINRLADNLLLRVDTWGVLNEKQGSDTFRKRNEKSNQRMTATANKEKEILILKTWIEEHPSARPPIKLSLGTVAMTTFGQFGPIPGRSPSPSYRHHEICFFFERTTCLISDKHGGLIHGWRLKVGSPRIRAPHV